MTMDVETAQAEFLRKVYAPAFVEKFAALDQERGLGLGINSEQDLQAALETTAMLKLAKLQAEEQGGGSPLAQGRDLLKQAMFGDDQAKEAAGDPGLLEATSALLGSMSQQEPQQEEPEAATEAKE